jgi:hypothetical protein
MILLHLKLSSLFLITWLLLWVEPFGSAFSFFKTKACWKSRIKHTLSVALNQIQIQVKISNKVGPLSLIILINIEDWNVFPTVCTE